MKESKPVGKSSLVGKVLRVLGKDSGFDFLLTSEETKPSVVSPYHMNYDFHNEFMNGTVQAEKSRAEGIMGYQKRNLPR